MSGNRSMVAAAALAALLAAPAGGLDFAFTYPADIDPQVLAGFQAAAARWQANFTDPITIRVNISLSSTLPDGVLGGTSPSRLTYQYNSGSTPRVLPKLLADATSPDDQLATSSLSTASSLQFLINRTTTNGGNTYLDNNASSNNTAVLMTTANAKALRLMSGQATEANTIQFSTKFTWDFDPRDGITAGAYDFVGLATHELGHAMGFLSGVDLIEQSTKDGLKDESALQYINTLDLFRYSDQSRSNGSGVFDLSADTRAKYFSIDGGNTSLANFATGQLFGDGQQASHWKQITDNLPTVDLMVPAVRQGQTLLVTDLDRRAFDVIGYDRNFTWQWAGGSGSWQQPLNWTAVGVPSSSITASFDTGSTSLVVVSFDDAASAAGLLVASDSVAMNLGGHNLNIGGSIQVGNVAGKSGALTFNGPGSVTVDSIYVGGTNQGAAGSGALTITPNVTASVATMLRVYAGAGNTVNLNGGSLSVGSVVNEGTFTAAAGVLTVHSAFTNTGTAFIASAQHWDPGSVLNNAGGTLILASDTGSSAAAGPALIMTSGAAYVQSAQHLSSLSVSGGTMSVSGGQPLVTRGLSVSGSGRIDIGTSDMVFFYAGNSPLASVSALVAAGQVYSSLAGLTHPTAVAVVDNAGLHLPDWYGEPLSGVSGDFRQLVLRATYLGDVNLDGAVTPSDLQNVLAHLNQPGTWFDGDMNGDGMVTPVDYALVFQNLGAGDNGSGGPKLFASGPFEFDNLSLNMVIIPEPVGVPLLAGWLLLLRRRRNKAA